MNNKPVSPSKRAKFTTVELGFLLVIMLAGALFRLYQLGATSLWQDEAHTLWLTQLSWKQMLDALLQLGVHPPLHFSLVKLTTSLFSAGEVSLRILSSLSDICTMAIVAWLGFRIAGTTGSIATSWLWAFHPMTIWYAREGRPYALALMFSTIAMVCYFRLREGRSRLAWAAAIISLALGMLTHYFVLLVGAGLILLSIFDRPQRFAFRRWALLFLASLIPLALWLASYFAQPEISLGIGWIDRPVLGDLAGTFWNLISGYGGIPRLPSTIAGMVVLVLILAAFMDKERRRLALSVLSAGVLLPVTATWLISQIRPIYMDRYFIVLLPFMAALVAMGAGSLGQSLRVLGKWKASLKFRPLIMICLVAAGIWSAWQVGAHTIYAKEDWRGLAAYLSKHEEITSDVWLSDGEAQVALEFYADEVTILNDDVPPSEPASFWYVKSQPYTATHAFSQAVSEVDRPWKLEPATRCQVTEHWESTSGLLLYHILCEDPSS